MGPLGGHSFIILTSLVCVALAQTRLPTCIPLPQAQMFEICRGIIDYPAASWLPSTLFPIDSETTRLFDILVTNTFETAFCKERTRTAVCSVLYGKCEQGADNVHRVIPPCTRLCEVDSCQPLIESTLIAILPNLNGGRVRSPCAELFSDADTPCVASVGGTIPGLIACNGAITTSLDTCVEPTAVASTTFQCPNPLTCPIGSFPFQCLIEPCAAAEHSGVMCTDFPEAICCDNYCDGCNAHYYLPNGNRITDCGEPPQGIPGAGDLKLGGKTVTDYFFQEDNRPLNEQGVSGDIVKFGDNKISDYYYNDLSDFYYTDGVADYFFGSQERTDDPTNFYSTDFFTDFTDGITDGPLLDTGVSLDTGIPAVDAVNNPDDYFGYWPGPHGGVDAPYDSVYGFGNVNVELDSILPTVPEGAKKPDINEDNDAWRDWLYHFYGSPLRDGEFGYYDALEWNEPVRLGRTKDMIMVVGLGERDTAIVFRSLIQLAVQQRNPTLRFEEHDLILAGIRSLTEIVGATNQPIGVDQLETISLNQIKGYNVMTRSKLHTLTEQYKHNVTHKNSKGHTLETSLCANTGFFERQMVVLFHVRNVPRDNIIPLENTISNIYTDTNELCEAGSIGANSRFFIRRPTRSECNCHGEATCVAPTICNCNTGYVGDGQQCFVDQCRTAPSSPMYGEYTNCRMLTSGVTQCTLACDPGKYKTNDAFCVEGRWITPLPRCTGARCGDGRINVEGEECDRDNVPVTSCSQLNPRWTTGVVLCTNRCTYDTIDCRGCGDGLVNQASEQCDTRDVPLRLCTLYDNRYWGGIMTCNNDCTYNTNLCWTQYCGDGRINQQSEQCDGEHRPAEFCAVWNPVKYSSGRLRCNDQCSLDYSDCVAKRCGDGVRNQPNEQCDGFDILTTRCTDLSDSYTSGALRCASDCTLDVSLCQSTTRCGNGLYENSRSHPEECDGKSFKNGDNTCASYAPTQYWKGTLLCRDDCTIDTSQCIAPVCGDGVRNQQSEECDDEDGFIMDCNQFNSRYLFGKISCSDSCNLDLSRCIERPETEAECSRAYSLRLEDHYMPDCANRDRCNCINDALNEIVALGCCRQGVLDVCEDWTGRFGRCGKWQCHCKRAEYGVCPTLMTCPETFVHQNCVSRDQNVDDCWVPDCPNHSDKDMLLAGCQIIFRNT